MTQNVLIKSRKPFKHMKTQKNRQYSRQNDKQDNQTLLLTTRPIISSTSVNINDFIAQEKITTARQLNNNNQYNINYSHNQNPKKNNTSIINTNLDFQNGLIFKTKGIVLEKRAESKEQKFRRAIKSQFKPSKKFKEIVSKTQILKQIKQVLPVKKQLPGISKVKKNSQNNRQVTNQVFNFQKRFNSQKKDKIRKKRSPSPNNVNKKESHKRQISFSLLDRKPLRSQIQPCETYSNTTNTSNQINGNFSQKFKIKEKFRIKQQLAPIHQFDKEQRQKIYRIIRAEYQSVINTSNQIQRKNSKFCFKAYIQKGNHGNLVKQLLKKRWWWSIEQKDPTKAHLVWTQWFNTSIVKSMKNIQNSINPMQILQYFPRQISENYSTTKRISLTGIDAIDKSTKFGAEQDMIKAQLVRKLIDQPLFDKLKQKVGSKFTYYFKSSQKDLCYRPKNIFQTDAILPNTYRPKILFKKQSMKQNNDEVLFQDIMHNHIDGCLQLHSKKLLFKNLSSFLHLKKWDCSKFIPLTYFIDRIDSQSYGQLLKAHKQFQNDPNSKNVWILKPGENSNRGCGISVVQKKEDLISQLKTRLNKNNNDDISMNLNGYKRTVIVQKYIENCFLINKRKFDIRCYILLTTINGHLKGYWYKDGYIRTSSSQYTLDDISDMMIHLTNDAVQKHSDTFGKFQENNKTTYSWFKSYLKRNGHVQQDFNKSYQKMKMIAYYLITSVSHKIKRKQFTFQLFGLDFMLDDKLNPFLIQANSNPCLDTKGVVLSKIIHQLIQNVIMIAIDPIFPQPIDIKRGKDFLYKDYFMSNKFQLIFTDQNSSLI